MSAPGLSQKGQRRIGDQGIVGAIILYAITISALLVALYSFKEHKPQIEEIRINHSTSSLEITGKNLDSDVRATALYQDSLCSNVVAKKFLWERVFDVKVKGSIAWALCRNVGLIALDISNPRQPEILRTLHINRFLWHLEIVGDIAYIACGMDGVVVCDISSPAQAKTLYVHNLPHTATDVTAAHDLIYVSTGKHGISVIDPEAGEIVHHLNVPGTALRLHVTEGRLFTISKYAKHGYLHIYSIEENPAQPKLLQELKFAGTPRDYVLKDNRLFLANGNAGIGVIELHEKKAATFEAALNTPLRSNRLALFGDQLVVFGLTGDIALYSFEADGGLKLSSSAYSCSRIYGADIFGHYAVIATNIDGISIVDLSTPPKLHPTHLVAQLPSRVESINWRITSSGISVRDGERLYYLKPLPDGSFNHSGKINYPASEFFNAYNIYNSRIYAAIKNSGLHVAKIAPDGTLQPGATVAFPKQKKFSIFAVKGHEDNLYLCTNDGLKVFDISNPDHPVYQAEQDIPGDIRSIAFGGGFAFISSFGQGIKISPLSAEHKLGPAEAINFPQHLIPEGKSLDITYADGFLFAACGYRGILSIDVRKPYQPLIMDSIGVPGYFKKVKLNQGVLGAKSYDSVYLFDVENPGHMRMLGKVDNVKDFYLGDGEMLYLQREGILRTPPPSALQLSQSSSTRLIFELPANNPKGSYNLFLNLNDKRSQLMGTLVNTPDGTPAPGWEFIRRQEIE